MPDAHVTPGQYLVARKTLTSAQVLAIHTTPVAIIADPGSGRLIYPLVAIYNYTAGTTPYTDGGGALGLFYGTHGLGNTVTTLGFWDQSVSQFAAPSISANSAILSEYAHTALSVANNTANPTLGNGTVTITVAYLVVPVS